MSTAGEQWQNNYIEKDFDTMKYEKLIFHEITECSHFFAVSSKTIYMLANGNAYSITNTVYYHPYNENLDFCAVTKMAYGNNKKTVWKNQFINR